MAGQVREAIEDGCLAGILMGVSAVAGYVAGQLVTFWHPAWAAILAGVVVGAAMFGVGYWFLFVGGSKSDEA